MCSLKEILSGRAAMAVGFFFGGGRFRVVAYHDALLLAGYSEKDGERGEPGYSEAGHDRERPTQGTSPP